MTRYGAAAERLRPAIERFSPDALRAWSAALGEETFVGSSGRVFPRSFKATPLLRAWLRRLDALGVALRPRRRLIGFGEGRRVRFAAPEGVEEVEAAGIVLALGGASWPRLGGDGSWVEILRAAGIAVARLRPANCAFVVDWSPAFRERFAGQPLKAIALAHGETRVRGEAMIGARGIEGGAVYALSAALRDAIEAEGSTILTVDLKPDLTREALAKRLRRRPGQSLSTFLRKAAASAAGRDRAAARSRRVPRRPGRARGAHQGAAASPHSRPRRSSARFPAPAASSGREIDDAFMLKKLPGVFVAGEMIDWEAPTGGYLLQASFATGAAAGRGAAAWIERLHG